MIDAVSSVKIKIIFAVIKETPHSSQKTGFDSLLIIKILSSLLSDLQKIENAVMNLVTNVLGKRNFMNTSISSRMLMSLHVHSAQREFQ